MCNPHLAALALAVALPLVFLVTGPFERLLYRADPKTKLKFVAYGGNVVLLWAMAGAAVWIEGWSRLLESPAVGAAWLWAPAISTILLGLGVAGYLVCSLLPLVQSLRGTRWRRAYGAAYRRSFSDIPGMLPDTAGERAAWVVLSVTAGICEEVLCRGFLIRFLHESSLALPLAAALVASSLIFGLGHVYQGVKGVVGTTIGGLVFGLLFLLTGSLLAGIVLHILIDLQVAYVMRPTPEDAVATAQAG